MPPIRRPDRKESWQWRISRVHYLRYALAFISSSHPIAYIWKELKSSLPSILMIKPLPAFTANNFPHHPLQLPNPFPPLPSTSLPKNHTPLPSLTFIIRLSARFRPVRFAILLIPPILLLLLRHTLFAVRIRIANRYLCRLDFQANPPTHLLLPIIDGLGTQSAQGSSVHLGRSFASGGRAGEDFYGLLAHLYFVGS